MKCFKSAKLLVLFTLLLKCFSANAQYSKLGKKLLPLYTKIEAISDTSYNLQDSAITIGVKLLDAELNFKDKKDSLFIADFSHRLAKLAQKALYFDHTAATYFLVASVYYRDLKMYTKCGVAMAGYLCCYNAIEKDKYENSKLSASDTFIFSKGSQDTTLWLTVKAKEIVWNKTKDTVFVTVFGGNAHGVKLDCKFDLFTTFDTFSNYYRKILTAGTGHITEVDDFFSYGYIVLDTAFHDTIYLTDAFEVKIDIDRKYVGCMLTDLAIYNIKIHSHDNKRYFSQGSGNMTVVNSKFDYPLKLAILDELQSAIKYYNELDSTILLTKIATGPYGGFTYQQVMEATTIFDLDAYLDYVRSYPARYINNKYNFVQTYITWVIGDCELGKNEMITMEKLFAMPEEDLIKNAQVYGKYFLIIQKHDSILMDMINTRSVDNASKAAYMEKFQKFSNQAGIFKTDSICRVALSWQYHVAGDNKKAVEWADKTWGMMKGYNKLLIAIYKAIYYSEMNKNEDALAMCDTALAVDSTNYYARGYKGWNLIKAGKPKQAYKLCKYAFEIDSSAQWTTINFGHALFLKGNKAEANRLYTKAFENMETPSSFYSGLLTDFNYFINNGIQEDEFKALKTKYTNYYLENYNDKLTTDSLKKDAENLREKSKYTEAIVAYKSVESIYLKNADKNWGKIRMMNRWIAYCYYKDKEYKRALGYYRKSADLVKKHGLGEDNLIDDLTDISHLYDWLNDTLRTMEYEARSASMDVSLREKREAKKLYILSIGTTASGHNDSFAMADASAISERLAEGSKLYFDGVVNHSLNGANATVSEVKRALDSAIYTLSANDVFVFYYAGWGKMHGEEFITLADGDFALKDLAGYLGQIPAGRQIHIADCNGLNWRKWYQNDNFGLLANQKSSLVFLGMKNSRIEESAMKHSVITDALMASWESTLAGGTITATNWVANASNFLMQNNRMYAIEMQTYGHDFIIGKAKQKTIVKDTIGPQIELFGAAVTRGGSNIAVVSSRSVTTGSITDESKIVYAAVNGIRISVSENGRFELPKELLGVKNLIIEAEDAYGNTAKREFLVTISDNSVSGNGVKYAYLFASTDYKNWSVLTNPLEDATAIGAILKENYGYKVEIIPNPSKRAITEKLDYIRRYNYSSNDQLMVFFAGHGLYDSVWGGFYVCPESITAEKDVSTGFETFYPQQKIADLLEGSSCKNVFLVMDVCFGGKMFDKTEKHEYHNVNDGYNVSPDEFVKRQLQISCRQFLTSGGNNYVADGVAGNHSPFASRFLFALEEAATKNEFLTASEIMDYLRTMRTIGNDKKSFPRYGFFGGDKDGEYVLKVMKKIRSTAIIAKE